ncbi:hypothetical protein DFH08DRAFT_795690 [Mycena albidolilacea]|uniref:Uncharacterized protein n=1 Tax=Mycena albidolilacea TaxID=1033008 RepID=A0AAD7ATE6_9AGAR|nr:hypothetical protein DFH08DRAFT_795690 [Mycena albidolilacea]
MPMKGEPSQIIDIGAEQGRRQGRLDWRDKDGEVGKPNVLEPQRMSMKGELNACPTDKEAEEMSAPGGARATFTSSSCHRREQLSSTRAAVIDESVIDESDDEGAAQEAKPAAKSPKAPSAATATKSKKSKATATNILPPAPVTSLAPTTMITPTDHDEDEGAALPPPQPKKHKEKSARERKADKEYQLKGQKQTIKLNESVYETTYHNHLVTIAKTHAGAKNATSILMHNVFKDVMQLRPGVGVPSTGGTHQRRRSSRS